MISPTEGTVFAGFKKIKLFTHGSICPEPKRENKTDAESNKKILANYLHYRLYELISPYHFKSRLVSITYTDTSKKYAPYTQWGYFLETEDHLEKRTNLSRVERRADGRRPTMGAPVVILRGPVRSAEDAAVNREVSTETLLGSPAWQSLAEKDRIFPRL